MFKAVRFSNKGIAVVLLVALALIVFLIKLAIDKASAETAAVSVEGLAEYLNGYGWVVSSQADINEVTIPAKFSEVYEQYNDIQKKQGFDLSKYRTNTVKKYTFAVLNYPQESGEKRSDVYANILVLGSKIIAADITCPALDGFTIPVDLSRA